MAYKDNKLLLTILGASCVHVIKAMVDFGFHFGNKIKLNKTFGMNLLVESWTNGWCK